MDLSNFWQFTDRIETQIAVRKHWGSGTFKYISAHVKSQVAASDKVDVCLDSEYRYGATGTT